MYNQVKMPQLLKEMLLEMLRDMDVQEVHQVQKLLKASSSTLRGIVHVLPHRLQLLLV